MPRNSGVTGQAWDTCQRCGFIHPIPQLVIQKGMKLCTCHDCVDKLLIERRSHVIEEVLSKGEELVAQDPLIHQGIDQEDINF